MNTASKSLQFRMIGNDIKDTANLALGTIVSNNQKPTIDPDDHLVVGDKVSIPTQDILGFFGRREEGVVTGFYNRSNHVGVRTVTNERSVARRKVRKIH